MIRWATRWTLSLYLSSSERPLKIFKLDVATGKKSPEREIVPADLAGIHGPINVLMTPDGLGYIYAFTRYLSDLYVVSGLN